MSLSISRDGSPEGWFTAPHGLWTADLPKGAIVLLAWLHSHSEEFLAKVTLSQCRRAMRTSSIYPWFDALEAAGFAKVVRGSSGQAAKITLLMTPWRGLFGRRNQSEIGLVTSPKSDCIEEQGEEQGSSLRSEEDQTQVSTRNQEKPTAVAVKAAQEYVDWHRSERQSDPVSPFQALRSVATALAKKGYTSDEIVDGFKETRVMSAKAVQDIIDRARAAAEGRTVGPAIPQSVLRAFLSARQWLIDHGVTVEQLPALMQMVAGFHLAHGFGVGEMMLRLAVALREQPDSMAAMDEFRGRLWRAQVDRFPGELADYPDAMERAYRNRYWRAA